MNRILEIGIGMIIFIVLLPALVSLGIRLIPGNVQPPLTTTERIYGDSIIKQRFDASRDNLSGIGLSIKNPNYQNKKDITVRLFNDRQELLRSKSINGASIADGDYVKFIFDPINDSYGEKYLFAISAEGADVSEALEVFYSDKPNLSFVRLYQPKSIPSLVTEIYGNIIMHLVGDINFFVFWICGVMLIVGFIIYIFSQTSKSKLL